MIAQGCCFRQRVCHRPALFLQDSGRLMLRSGMRVLVPFGNGNRKKEAVVLAVSAGEEAKLKAVEQALDEEPVLTAEQLRLAGFRASGISARIMTR